MKVAVAAVGDAGILKAVDSQRGDWQQSQGAEVLIREQPVVPGTAAAGADVLLFPGDRLGDLVDAGALAVLPESAVLPPPKPRDDAEVAGPAPEDSFDLADVLPAYRDQVSKYGKDRMALPFGGSALVLVYRRDAFSGEANRAAAEKAGVRLEPPKTWEQLDALAGFFRGRDGTATARPIPAWPSPWGRMPRDWETPSCSPAPSGGAAPGPVFLLVRRRHDGAEDRLAAVRRSPGGGMAAWKACGPPGPEGFDGEAARSAFRAGRSPC